MDVGEIYSPALHTLQNTDHCYRYQCDGDSQKQPEAE